MTDNSPSNESPKQTIPSRVENTRSIWRFLGVLFLLGTIIAMGVTYSAWRYYQHWLVSPLNIESPYEFQVKPGQTLVGVGRDLEAAGVLKHADILRIYARLTPSNKIHSGDYRLDVGATPTVLINKLVAGDVIVNQITFIEGWTVSQFLAALARSETLDQTLMDKTPQQIAQVLGITGSLEGWFFPDTYVYHRGALDVDILRQAYERMKMALDEEWQKRDPSTPYKTPYEALIMASIVERETGHEAERGDVAGVFVRRLQVGMKLQTDPTVIYGMGDRFKGKITRKDLETPTPYNTYVISGLPPTPISNPSRAAIRAALNPAKGDALYFVAKGDGTSHFSKTLAEHNRAVRKYQLNRRADYRAAPPPKSSSSAQASSSAP